MLTFAALPAPWDITGSLLLLGVAVLLAGGFIRYKYDTLRLGRMPKRTELPQTILLIIFAVIAWRVAAEGTSLASLGVLVTGGIILGFAGDLFMADVFNQKDYVLYGMVSFAAGHVCYMLGFREIALVFDLHVLGSYLTALVVLWIAAGLIWFLMVYDPTADRRMQFTALGYALFLASMAAYALGMALQQKELWPLAIGGLLFLLSDALIAARLFGGRRFRYMGDVIWATYIIAQALIVTVVPVTVAMLAP